MRWWVTTLRVQNPAGRFRFMHQRPVIPKYAAYDMRQARANVEVIYRELSK